MIVGRLIPAGTGDVVSRLKQVAAERDREAQALTKPDPANEPETPTGESSAA